MCYSYIRVILGVLYEDFGMAAEAWPAHCEQAEMLLHMLAVQTESVCGRCHPGG